MTKQIFCHGFATRYRVLNGSFCLPNILNVLNSLTFLSHNIENRAFRKNREVWGIVFCVSKTRGVSSPFICYRFGKISKYIFTTGYANVTAYKKRACSPPNMANSAKDLFRHSTKKWEDETNILPHFCSASPLKPAFHTSNNIALRRTELGENKRAGGTPGRSQPPAKKLIYTKWKQYIFKKIL